MIKQGEYPREYARYAVGSHSGASWDGQLIDSENRQLRDEINEWTSQAEQQIRDLVKAGRK